jgi:serine/threonine protein phosphatase 1
MIANLFGRSKETARRLPRGGAGKRCYAIGDVHGRLDLLDQLFAQIAEHNASRPPREAIVVMLGDTIDRGPDSRGVVTRLKAGLPFQARLLCLKGNHEEMLVRGLSGEPDQLQRWLDYGGYECAQSYGVEIGSLFGQPPDILEHALGSAIPVSHVRFLDGFIDSIRFGDYLFAHAGIRPGQPLDAQLPHDLRWIRQGFLDSTTDHGFVVVHGHSITLEVEEKPNRIGIDTGAYKTGVLTAIWIEDEQRGYLQVTGPPGEPQ